MTAKPVARLTDTHVCPLHGTNAIISGAETILVNNLPMARVGDTTACGATIVTGVTTIFGENILTAHLGSETSHGGIIATGSMDTFVDDGTNSAGGGGGSGGGASGATSETLSLVNVIKEYLGSVLSGEKLEESLVHFDKYLDVDMDLETTRQMIDEFAGFGSVGKVGKVGKGVKSVNKPSVSDSKLENLVNDLYKGANTKKPIGTGSTADAIRQEALSGKQVGGKFHTEKGQQYSNALNKWLRKNPDASASDRQAAQSILDDLTDALGGGK